MKDIIADDFQNLVDETLIQNRSLLDIISKYLDATARTNRAISKAVTHCGCIQLNAKKQAFPANVSIDNMKDLVSNHIEGELCPKCREIIEQELGLNLYYIAAVCNALGLSLYDVLLKERSKIETLGRFNMR